MAKTYFIDGHQVIVSRCPKHLPKVYTIYIAGTPATSTVEKTLAGRFLALDDQRRVLGTYAGLRKAVERVVSAHADRLP